MFASIADQAVLSAFNLFINLLLIKLWQPSEYGAFSIIFSVGLVLTGFQNALINTPLSVMLPTVQAGDGAYVRLNGCLGMMNAVLVIVVALLTMMVWQLPWFPLFGESGVAAAAYIGSLLYREYLRNRTIVLGAVAPILIADIAYVAVAGFLLSIFWLMPNIAGELTLDKCLWVLAINGFVTLFPLWLSEWRALDWFAWRKAVSAYPKVWGEARWSLVGVATTELQNRAYVFVIGFFFGPAAVGLIQAARIFFGPLNLIASAWARVARPRFALLLANKQTSASRRLIRKSLLVFLAMNVLFAMVLSILWEPISAIVFEERYPGIGVVVMTWCIATLVFHMRSVFSVAVQATNDFRPLAVATIYGAIFSLLTLLVFCWRGAYQFSVIGVAVGELVTLVITVRLMLRFLANSHANQIS